MRLSSRAMRVYVHLMAILFATVFAWALIAFLATPLIRKWRGHGFVEVPGFASLSLGQPVELDFPWVAQDAYIRQSETQQVWIIKHGPDEVTVFSPICPHLGCRYAWHPSLHEFVCPCHGSVFTITGKVVAGPAPRPLDTLPHEIKEDKLYVKWERFKPGIPQKVVIAHNTPECCGQCPFRTACLDDPNACDVLPHSNVQSSS